MDGLPALPPPAVPYGATAVRPHWPDLPADLRAAIAGRLGVPVVWSTTATGGFTRGFAAVLDTADGGRAFVKAARLVDERHLCDWYAHEVAVTAALPASVPAPRPLWSLTAVGYYVVCFTAVEGRVPALPWSPADLSATLSAWAATAAALREWTPPADLFLPSLGDLARADLSWWQEILHGRSPLPPGAAVARDHVAALARLEARLPVLADAAPGLSHGDLRMDNVIIDPSGSAWLCDWSWVYRGPAWFDTVGLLVTAYASGLDADALVAAHPTLTSTPSPTEAVDAALATLSGYYLSRAAAPPTDASPHLRAHQRWSGEATLGWLAARQGWSAPAP